MSTIYYHPHPPNTDKIENYQSHPFIDLLYDLEPINPPHTKFKSQMDVCPAMNIYRNHTYLLRSPVDMELRFEPDKGEWFVQGNMTEEVFDLIIPPGAQLPYLQLKIYYLFWSEKKTNDKLWMHDVPLHEVKQTPSFYVASGMIPVGEYTRNTSIGLILNTDKTTIKIKRGQPLAAFTLVGDSQIKLVKKLPTQKILDTNLRHFQTPRFCPYYATKTFFSRWLNHES